MRFILYSFCAFHCVIDDDDDEDEDEDDDNDYDDDDDDDAVYCLHPLSA